MGLSELLPDDRARRHLHLPSWSLLSYGLPTTLDSQPEERALLFRYCWNHAAAECSGYAKEYRITELATDLFGGQELLCPRCRANLIASVRAHFYNCSMLPAAVRQRAREAREVAQRLVKQVRELADRADVLMRELEGALHALREAAVQEQSRSSKLTASAQATREASAATAGRRPQ